MSPEQIARRCADTMWPDDHAARGLGMEILAVGPGSATLAMSVRPDMVNGHARHQGGRSGTYDIEVENQDGKLIALFRGRAARIKGHFFEMPDNPASPEGR